MRYCFGLFLSFVLMSQALAFKTVAEQKETPQMLLDLKYPSGLPSNAIEHWVETQINQAKKGLQRQLEVDKHVEANVPGKSSLYLRYEVVYDSQQWLSIRLNFSAFARGAAHPNHWVETMNAHQGKVLQLSDIFESVPKTLSVFSKIAKQTLMTKHKHADKEWIIEGTKADAKNFSNWLFTEKGIEIVLEPYQVLPYVFGPQDVTVLFSALEPIMKPRFRKQHWGAV
jgi:Protein of unknown function (DUF3298)/Deacetylase PdaC